MTKETEFYWVRYTCRNCGKTVDVQVPYGKTIPIYSDNAYNIEMGYVEQAPECENCGCRMGSHGKALL